MIKKRLLNIIAVLGIFGFLLMLPVRAVAVESPFCQPDKGVFEKIGAAFEVLDIRKTVANMIFSAATDGPINAMANRNPTQMMECSYYVLKTDKDKLGDKFKFNDLLAEMELRCERVIANGIEANCKDFVETYDSRTGSLNMGGRQVSYNETTTAGSLLGIANTLEGGVRTEPLPVNLALFWNDSIKNVPFAGTALAADTSYANAPFVGAILQIWKTSRNIAFGLLSIVMLTVGVMIMTRKKLSPQAVVTAQYALPRIVMAVILITFSYPVGAVMASSMRYLTDVLVGIIQGASSYGTFSAGGIIALMFPGLLRAGGAAVPIMIMAAVLILIVLVLYALVWVKAILIYMKLIISIVFAPVSFALGAIPGNEALTTNWFKHAVVYVLSYIGMFAYINVAWVVLATLIATPASNPFTGAGVAQILVFMLLPVLTIWVFLQALKVPGKVETLIMGDPKKPVRK